MRGAIRPQEVINVPVVPVGSSYDLRGCSYKLRVHLRVPETSYELRVMSLMDVPVFQCSCSSVPVVPVDPVAPVVPAKDLA